MEMLFARMTLENAFAIKYNKTTGTLWPENVIKKCFRKLSEWERLEYTAIPTRTLTKYSERYTLSHFISSTVAIKAKTISLN